ncbi:hypothetical protein Zmor_024365 [Zophobas morio]|uniref:Uncharacterized protein n=1 Tax=Zophobas morio TaxID=2755281 RepID=A0AA38M804_9CUCU|nr:hypothetical protein Zmor_024365 [Zophobas morio]
MQALENDPYSAKLIPLMYDLLILIEKNKVNHFKKRLSEASMWDIRRTKSGLKLILEAIKWNSFFRKEIFDHLLHDCYSCCSEDFIVANEFGKTAIEVAWDQKNNNTQYYLCELLKSSSYLEKVIKNTVSNSSDYIDEEHITSLLTYATDLPDIFDRQ